MNFNFKNHRGILFVGLVVAAIIFFSKDLECILLMTGIIVNIIAICLNTGATNFKNKNLPKEFLPARRRDLVEKYYAKEKFDDSPIPKEEKADIVERSREKRSEDRGESWNITMVEPYKGAIDYENCTGEMYPETAMDNATTLSIKHQGINTKRQIAGAMRRKKVLVPYISQELTDEEDKIWWGAFDA